MGRDRSVFIDCVSERLCCSICLDVLKEATYIGCPQDHIFCKGCLDELFNTTGESSRAATLARGAILVDGDIPNSERWTRYDAIRKGNVAFCPMDRTLVSSANVKPAGFVERLIGDLSTRCNFIGCTWTGLAADKHEDKCQYASMVCAFCRDETIRAQFEDHLLRECSDFPWVCPRGMGVCGILKRGDIKMHEPLCRFYKCRFSTRNMCAYPSGTATEVYEHEESHFSAHDQAGLNAASTLSGRDPAIERLSDTSPTSSGSIANQIGQVEEEGDESRPFVPSFFLLRPPYNRRMDRDTRRTPPEEYVQDNYDWAASRERWEVEEAEFRADQARFEELQVAGFGQLILRSDTAPRPISRLEQGRLLRRLTHTSAAANAPSVFDHMEDIPWWVPSENTFMGGIGVFFLLLYPMMFVYHYTFVV